MVLIPDRAILAMMGGQTLIWAALFYSFVALVPDWQAAFGWSDTALMAAFSLAGVIWAITTPAMGRAIDAGRGPIVMPVAGLVGAAILVALSGVSSYLAFLTLWGAMGVMMAATLYEPAFAMVLRARGAGGRDGITAIAIAAGFASTICYPVAHIVSDAWGWRMAMLTMAGIAAGLAVPLLAIGARWLERDTPATAAPGARPRANWGAVAGLPKFP
ncbi:MAG: MFS transporter, partial [Pseudomonadota bacterium]